MAILAYDINNKKLSGRYTFTKIRISQYISEGQICKIILKSIDDSWVGILFCQPNLEAELLSFYLTPEENDKLDFMAYNIPDIRIINKTEICLDGLYSIFKQMPDKIGIDIDLQITDTVLRIRNKFPIKLLNRLTPLTIGNDLLLNNFTTDKSYNDELLKKWIGKKEDDIVLTMFSNDFMKKFKVIFEYFYDNLKIVLPVQYYGISLTTIKQTINNINLDMLQQVENAISKNMNLTEECLKILEYIKTTTVRSNKTFQTKIGGFNIQCIPESKNNKLIIRYLNKPLVVNKISFAFLMGYFNAINKGEQLMKDINKFKLLNC